VHLVKISDKMEELVIFELNPFLGVFHRGESSFKAAAS